MVAFLLLFVSSFLVGSFVGWIYEEIFYSITEGRLRNRGILYGSWLPIYGIETLCIYLAKPLKKHPVWLFLVCVAATGVVEFLIGFAGLSLFHLRLWDYRGLFLNLGGIVCFRSVFRFGLLGLFFHYAVEPRTRKIFQKTAPAVLLEFAPSSCLFFSPISFSAPYSEPRFPIKKAPRPGCFLFVKVSDRFL